ncbi:MAG: rRNA maturation RNase YbeY [Candidatus Kerfeldbacteria bacterium]|nr:rRNA maturation RNase YbeY [Candidatus Kerfeldbacteria bacterium]
MGCEVAAVVRLPVTRTFFRRRLDRALRMLHYNPKTVTVSLAFVGDTAMRRLNQHYRRQPGTTDVLSFPGRRPELGEIVVSVPQARRQARRYGTAVSRELLLLSVHGLLHLAGYDHHRARDRQRMQAAEQRLVGQALINRSRRRS